MSTLHLICGMPGAGKTTLARKLENELPALLLETDTWMTRIVGNGFDEPRRRAVEAVQLDLALRCLVLGTNVVLDWGFWSRDERQKIRAAAEAAGATATLHYLNVPFDVRTERVLRRNSQAGPGNFPITRDQLQEWENYFEEPQADEL